MLKGTGKKIASLILLAMFTVQPFSDAAAIAETTEGSLSVKKLQVDYTENPIGTDNLCPKFSWQLSSGQTDVMQKSYRIGVSSSKDNLDSGKFDVWDSGEIQSDKSSDISYEGSALESMTRYYWSVAVTDNKGENAVSTEEAYWETGLLQQSDWTAEWIRCEDSNEPDNYTIDFDMTIVSENAGFVFAAYDTSNCLMWQFGTKEHGSFYLRPHVWSGGQASVIDEVPISEAVVPLSRALNTKHHVTIAVEKDKIFTYLNGTLIDEREYGAAKFGKIGFRQFKGGTSNEQAVYDNIVVKSDTGKILFSEDFQSGSNASFGAGTVSGGALSISDAFVLQTSQDKGSAPMYRKAFTAEKQIKSARLYASALGLYEIEINGSKVGDDFFNPGWTAYELNQDDNNYVMYQTFDVTDYLKIGENVIGAVTGHGWYSGKLFVTGNNRYGAASKFLCQLQIEYTDGSTAVVVTDKSWQTTASGPIISDDFQLGESYDAQKEMSGWSTAEFAPDESWISATEYAYDGDIIAQVGPTVKAIQEFSPISINKLSNGAYIVDIGQNIAGFARLNNVVGSAGTQVKLRFGEMLNDDGTLYTDNLRSAKSTDYYTLKGDQNGETWQPRFTFHGFRYVEITNYPGELTVDSVTCVALSSLQERTGTFETSNELVNQLQSNITWGQRDNFISVPTDCPQRDERLGYTGDGQVFIRTAALNMNVNRFFEKYMADVSSNQRSDGAIADWTPNYVPNDSMWSWSGTFGTSGWGDAVVIIPWSIYAAYGNTGIIKDNYEAMQKWVARYQKMGGSRLIVDSCTYGDWLSVNAETPTDVISTGYFAYCADLMSKMAEAIGKTEDASAYRQLFLDVRDAFNREFVDSEAHVKGRTQTSYLLALKFDLLKTQSDREKAAKYLVDDIRSRDWHLSTGFLGVSYLCPMLSEMGYSDVAYKLLLQEDYPSWLYSVNNGATTIWERWNSYTEEDGFGDVGMNSFNHYSLGSVGEWFYNYVAGINYDEENPGYKHFTIAPNVSSSLKYVNCSYETVYGTIVSNWTYDKATGNTVIETAIPANTTATVSVPADSADKITINGANTADGVRFAEYKDGKAIYEVGSGSYTFKSVYTEDVTVSVESSQFAYVSVNSGEPQELPIDIKCKPGEQITLEPTVINDIDYSFKEWSGDVSSELEMLTITPEEDISVNLDVDVIAAENLAYGKTVTSNSYITNDSAGWNIRNLTDGKLTSTDASAGYTSNSSKSPSVDYWVQIDLGENTLFDCIRLYPRTNALASDGTTCSFPKDFSVEVKKSGKSDYTTVAQYKDYTAPYKKPAVIDLQELVSARYIRLHVTRVGAPPTGEDYYLQLAEMGVYQTRENTVDKSALKAQLDLVAEYKQSDYTADSYAKLISAVEAANAVYNDSAVLQKDIDEQTKLLTETIAGLKKAGDVNVSVTVSPTNIKLSRTKVKLKVGKAVKVTASVLPTSATDKTVKWSSSNSKVAVYEEGKITAKRAGVAYITASTSNGRTAKIKVTVNPGKPTAVKLTKKGKNIIVSFKAPDKTAKKYQIRIKAPGGKTKRVTVSKRKYKIKNAKKGIYRIRVRGYYKSGKTVLTSGYTAAKKIRFK